MKLVEKRLDFRLKHYNIRDFKHATYRSLLEENLKHATYHSLLER